MSAEAPKATSTTSKPSGAPGSAQGSHSSKHSANSGNSSTSSAPDVIDGRYKVGKVLGRGSYAVVRECTDLQTGDKYAMKVLDKMQVVNAGLQQQLRREIAVMLQLSHPNVLRLYKCLQGRKFIYLLLELAEGGELFERMKEAQRQRSQHNGHTLNVGGGGSVQQPPQGGKITTTTKEPPTPTTTTTTKPERENKTPGLPEDHARKFFRQLCAAIQYCHAQGIAHRDVKPQNLLLKVASSSGVSGCTALEGGILKISDFGLANFQRTTASGRITTSMLLHTRCGTPQYMAPEVLQNTYGGYNGYAADMWSCGVVLFHLVVGQLPFTDTSLPGLFNKITKGQFNVPQHLSAECKDMICKLMCSNVEERLSAQHAWQHPWLWMGETGGVPSSPGTFDPIHDPTEQEVEESMRDIQDHNTDAKLMEVPRTGAGKNEKEKAGGTGGGGQSARSNQSTGSKQSKASSALTPSALTPAAMTPPTGSDTPLFTKQQQQETGLQSMTTMSEGGRPDVGMNSEMSAHAAVTPGSGQSFGGSYLVPGKANQSGRMDDYHPVSSQQGSVLLFPQTKGSLDGTSNSVPPSFSGVIKADDPDPKTCSCGGNRCAVM